MLPAMKRFRSSILALVAGVLVVPMAVLAVEPAATPQPKTPPANPDAAIKSPRDAASGQATGKRQHKPIRFRPYYDQAVQLNDGRVVLVNTKTGEVEFGDASEAGTPPIGEAPPNGTYKMKDGSPLVIKAGVVLKFKTPTPTPFLPKPGGDVPVLR